MNTGIDKTSDRAGSAQRMAAIFYAGIMASAIAGSTLAAADAETNAEPEFKHASGTMEHVEVTGYTTPASHNLDSDTDPQVLVKALQRQQRRELLRTIEPAQLKQLEAFRLEDKNQSGESRESLAQETPEELQQLPQQLEPADQEAEEGTGSAEPTQETQSGESQEQEPS